MNFLKKNLFFFIFAVFVTTACFSADPSTEQTTQPTNHAHSLSFEKNGIKVEIQRITEDPRFGILNNYRACIKITNNTASTIATTEKLFKNVSTASLRKMYLRAGLILSPIVSGLAGTVVAIGGFGPAALAKFIIDTGIKYLGNNKNYQPKDSYKDHLKLGLIIGGATAAATLTYCLYYLYNECKFKEKTIQPNQEISFITYISANDFEKIEKGLLIPELDVKKLDK